SAPFGHGLTARSLAWLRARAGVDSAWLDQLLPLDAQARKEAIERAFAPVLERGLSGHLVESPLSLLLLGANFPPRKRPAPTEGPSLGAFALAHLKHVAETDLERNWFAWLAIAGELNHRRDDAWPPYLRPDRYASSRRSRTALRLHHRAIQAVLDDAP